MLTEVDVEAPQAAVRESYTYDWLERVESSVENAHAALLGPERTSLPDFTADIESACRERNMLSATPAMAPRLGVLRERLTLLQSLLRHAAAFVEAREQME